MEWETTRLCRDHYWDASVIPPELVANATVTAAESPLGKLILGAPGDAHPPIVGACSESCSRVALREPRRRWDGLSGNELTN